MSEPIKKEFKHLEMILVGTPKQFLLQEGEYFCVRENCEGCVHVESCKNEDASIKNTLIPSSRRGVGFEEKHFLVLSLKEGFVFDLPEEGQDASVFVPKELWNTPYDNLSLDERNLHFILSDLQKPFRVLKGQFRYYGTKEDFNISEYSKYFEILSEYIPAQHVVALDFSAIEPRFSTIATRCKAWLEIFKGKKKSIVKEVSIPDLEKYPKQILKQDKVTYCLLLGELDKATFEGQCKKCELSANCKTIKDHKKNIPGDWHGVNRDALFGNRPDFPKNIKNEDLTEAQKSILKGYRDAGKPVGLGLTYGGGTSMVMQHLGVPEKEADQIISDFFKSLPDVQNYTLFQEKDALSTGIVKNMFGRVRDVSQWAFSQAETNRKRMQDQGYAVRTALNHPIQSTAAEVLKLAMLRADEFITKNGYSPLQGLTVPQNISGKSYLDIVCGMLLSIHDEIDFNILTNRFDAVIPPLYRVLQVPEIIKSLGVDLTLEMDVEYDPSRSFTASIKYPASKIFLLNEVLSGENKEVEPNILLLNIEHITPLILEKIKTEAISTEKKYFLGVKQLNSVLVFTNNKFEESFLQGLGLSFQKGYLPLQT